MGTLRGVTRGLALIKTAVLARVLLPAQFGIYGIATLVLGLLEMMTETGINIFLIQEKKKIDEYVDSAWVVAIIRGILIGLIIFLSIPIVTRFFATPGAKSILILISFVPVIRGFINPACVKFQKNLQFNKQFSYDSVIFLIDTVVAVSLGILTKNENSIIWGMIVAGIFEVFLSFAIFSPKPKFRLMKEKVARVLERGKWITGAGIFNYLFQNLDDIFVGRILGTASLGIYQQAYRISTLPVSEVGEVFNKVTFPVFVSMEGENSGEAGRKRLKKAFLRTLLIISLLVIPFGFAVFYFPYAIINLILGEKWLSAVPVLQILAIFGVVKAIFNSFFSLFLGIGKQEIVTFSTFVSTVVMAAAIYPFIQIFGILGAGFAAILATIVSFPILIFYFFKYFNGR